MVTRIVISKADQPVNASCVLTGIDFVPPKGRRWPCTRRGKRPSAWMTAAVPSLPWNGLESLDWAEMLAAVMPDSDVGKVAALLVLLIIAGGFKLEIGWFKLEIRGKR